MAAEDSRRVSSPIVSASLVAAQFALCTWIALSALIATTARLRSNAEPFNMLPAWLAPPSFFQSDAGLLASRRVGMGLVVVGVAFAVWALLTMGVRRLRVFPEPGAEAKLVSRGPYAWVRHPMYSGLLLAMLGLVMLHPAGWNLAAWCLLVFVLWLKARREERLLEAAFPDYPSYMRRTGRFTPPLRSFLHAGKS